MATIERPAFFKGYGARVERFVETHIRQTKGRWNGEPLSLEPWQREVLDELFLVNADGNNVYREALLGLPRKNGKSTLMSAIALYGLLAAGEHGAEVYCAAASKDQARIVFQQAKEFVETSPELRKWLTPQRSLIKCESTNGVFRVLSSDAPLQHGLNPSMVVIDELWAHKDPELYYALTTGQLARLNPLVISITTAGWDRESIGWQVYERAVELERQGIDAMREARFYCKWYGLPEGADITDEDLWMEANPASWIVKEDLRLEKDRLPEFVFRRLHGNQWTQTEEAWVTPDEWDACKGKPEFDPNLETFYGIDIGLTRDASAHVWCQWHGDELHIFHDIRVPTAGRPITAEENRGILMGHSRHIPTLHEVPYDPYSFRESAEMLEGLGLPMVEYPQNNSLMCPASEAVYELIKEKRLVHDGDVLLRKMVLDTVCGETERGWRISKKKSLARIDGTVAMTMAADRAIYWKMTPPRRNDAAFM
jgi:phage terminase large subunit-like protein